MNEQVTVHVSDTPEMNFLDKNFTYTRKSFGDFMHSVANGQKEYLRATSSTNPTEKATHLQDDFPTLAEDFQLPKELAYVTENEHSSPLRVSGPVAMWLHYDVSTCQYLATR